MAAPDAAEREGTAESAAEIEAAAAALAGSRTPWLFGVRHHSPACAAALPPLLDALAPAAVAIELPEDLESWLPWLGHPKAVAPLAVAGVSVRGEELGFYPFADFSPELVAIRWARARGVPVHAIDLPMGRRREAGHGARRETGRVYGIDRQLAGESGDSWELLVEAPGAGGEPERVRRAALLYGWALRLDAARGDGVDAADRAREEHMRARLAQLGAYATAPARPVAAIVGAFHASALLAEPALWSPPPPAASDDLELVTSLIPYAFELLDARSGYPAGIKDPAWQQRLWETLAAGGDPRDLVAACLVEITREVRALGLAASVPDAAAAAAVAGSLAQLRRLPAPGRRELVEAAQTALAHGELLGRGRAVARAMERVLVGRRRGTLAPGTPRSGLAPHVLALLDELRLPREEMTEYVEQRLDPLRSRIDRRRHVALFRMAACGIPYGTLQESAGAAGGVENLTELWRLWFTPASEAVIELAGLRGVTLRQAATGALRADAARLAAEGRLGPLALVQLTYTAAEAGAGELVREWLAELAGPRLADATLTQLIHVIALIDRIAAGHAVGLPASAAAAVPGEIDVFEPPPIDRALVLGAAVASLLGLAGSDSVVDARALAELVRLLERPEHAALGEGRLRWSIDRLAETGTPLIAGAAAVVQVLIGARAAEALAAAIGAWFDGATDAAGRRVLARRLHGAIAVAGPLFEAAPVFLDGLCERVERASDEELLPRVPALREGFEVLSTASRRRLLRVIGERLGDGGAAGGPLDAELALAPEAMLAAADADRAGRAAMARVPRPVAAGADIESRTAREPAREAPHAAVPSAAAPHAIGVRDRWRLILGLEREELPPRARAAARALDELYGQGHGEGSGGGDLSGGGPPGAGFPSVRAWREEIEAAFGPALYEEVAAKAAAAGRTAALLELAPDRVTPSVELLAQVLSLKGGLGEQQLGRLRELVQFIVGELVRELAVRVRPALQGPTGARPTRRPTGALHLPRTIAANLGRARVEGGALRLVPERLIWRAKSRRYLDWHVILAVDVSGSMESSVIHSAMMAAILSAVPWVDVHFIAFSTEVVDLSAHVGDPLALLLEISVGGGTHTAQALRYVRELVTVPSRTLAIVVSDFEEGTSVEAMLGEVRHLIEAGVTCLGLAALDDRGAPRYAVPIAEQLVAAGMPVAALTPVELARWIGERIG